MVLQSKFKTIGGIVRPFDYEEPVFFRPVTPAEQADPTLPTTPAQIGDIVLFAIGPNTFRPLLVVSLGDFGKVSGTVFLNPDLDSSSPWVHRNCFSKPQKSAPYSYVDGVRYGDKLGEWREKPTSFVSVPSVWNPEVLITLPSTITTTSPDPRATE